MEELLRRELGCGSVRATGHTGGGCISQGRSYDTDRGRVFVKVNPKAEVRPRVGRAGGPVSVRGGSRASARGAAWASPAGGRGWLSRACRRRPLGRTLCAGRAVSGERRRRKRPGRPDEFVPAGNCPEQEPRPPQASCSP